MDGRMDESTPVLINNKEQGQVLANFLMTLRVGPGGAYCRTVSSGSRSLGAWGSFTDWILSLSPSASLFYYHWPRML